MKTRKAAEKTIITAQDEKEIFELYRSGESKTRIIKKYKLTHHQYAKLIRLLDLRNENRKKT